ncbi:hypothetical protein NAEGRDRAFT_77359 [Naegleria gruberi]|uniref:PPi-type phosphoenolpyruvate carboxykinase lobe 2 domain-containing protein n=1 Tax=Naegleria gruberi TaxID=5762 RepID=D2VDJ5_NAEGR|nr:uncharacterized protein NAEGRDRAFT_77359 [Naegleria gruberi]EFC45152.1 hypothetical protein NAEGRDRAFT_77359 [Naegleria gruberi]|eukprot:XP_002677896.1 hypothetical protein NAEGRDRAFT_77359 [Naegleria gruberi strain NEG-M]
MTTHCSFFEGKELSDSIGYYTDLEKWNEDQTTLKQYVNLKLSASGLPLFGKLDKLLQITDPLLNTFKEHDRLLDNYQCPIDKRIQSFINSYVSDLQGYDVNSLHLPANCLELDRVGMARLLSLPGDGDKFENDIVCSYRLKQGVLHNPVNDRRTTQGSFHIALGGLPVPADKMEVPKLVWANLLKEALNPPSSNKTLPYTSNQCEEKKAKCWVSLMLRPLLSPAVPGESEEKTMEVRFFAPGSLVSNLDFVESIFGNAGHAYYTENDAALDVRRWSGHTGCVILAPHLTKVTKKSLGLPHISTATDRQKRDGMCYEKDTDLYNMGEAFKITCRTNTGVILTIIADNYFGYCKKEVKSQMTYATNLYGNCEEEHSGGAIAFPSYYLGDTFRLKDYHIDEEYTFKEMTTRCNGRISVDESLGMGIDNRFSDILYLPEDAFFTLHGQNISWSHYKTGEKVNIRLKPNITYILPSGYRVEMIHEKSGFSLIGTVGTGTYCHKPSTISGGGKSEISKSIGDAIITGPVIVADFMKDLETVEQLIEKDYSKRFQDKTVTDTRAVLSMERSLGSVVKLLTCSESYTEEYNQWLLSIPSYIKQLVFIVKSLYKPSWEGKWKEKFSVDLVNGSFGNSLKYKMEPVVGHYMRVGFQNNSWRTFELRKDFTPAFKIQTEDDMTSSVVVPIRKLQSKYLQNSRVKGTSIKISKNTEFRLFQRPDDCIIRGYDKKCESDLATPNTFICNFEALDQKGVQDILDDTISFHAYTKPQRQFLEEYAKEGVPSYCVASSNTRVVGPNQRSKNPRYLQNSEELTKPRKYYLAEVCTRLHQVLSPTTAVVYPVDAVISGRRNNPEMKGVPPLCVHNPIHYLELPELFMEYISSMTGKSPSTTGACGSEGALTKGPFCPILSITELNTALVSMILTGSDGYFSSAGTLGPNYRVDHDVSLLIPEIWCRMKAEERDPSYLIKNDMLEKLNDFEHNGQLVQASRLGYRITKKFVRTFFGRLFTNPSSVFTDDMLQPEKQGVDTFVKSLGIILDTYKSVALSYFEDGSIDGACPPLKAVLHVMAHGHYNGKSINDSEIRQMFTEQALLSSEWYKERLATRQKVLINCLNRSKEYLTNFSHQPRYSDLAEKLNINEKLSYVESELVKVSDVKYLEDLVGHLGTDPFMYK